MLSPCCEEPRSNSPPNPWLCAYPAPLMYIRRGGVLVQRLGCGGVITLSIARSCLALVHTMIMRLSCTDSLFVDSVPNEWTLIHVTVPSHSFQVFQRTDCLRRCADRRAHRHSRIMVWGQLAHFVSHGDPWQPAPGVPRFFEPLLSVYESKEATLEDPQRTLASSGERREMVCVVFCITTCRPTLPAFGHQYCVPKTTLMPC